MTHQEKLIRAREACAAGRPQEAKEYRDGEYDSSTVMSVALRVLNDLDKPIPDPDEAWRPFLQEFYGIAFSGTLHPADRKHIARIKAARHLMPPETDQ